MTTPKPIQPPQPPAEAGRGLLRGLLPDYNRAAATYWWLLALAGALALAWSVAEVAAMPSASIWQIVVASAIATAVGMVPLQIPKTKTSIAAGDIFIFLLLPVHGPFAAAVAAASEAAACAWRTSDRWSSWIAGPAAAAVSMLACGHVFTAGVAALGRAGVAGDGVTFIALLAFAALYFVVGPNVVTAVIYLKRWRAPTLAEWLTTFGWLGMNYLGSASIAGVLFVAFQQFGLMSVIVAAPMIAMFVASLRMYFAQQESSERAAAEKASRERAEHAEREATLVADHLRALELSDRRFQSAFDHAAIGMALVSTQGQLVQVNPALCALLGAGAEDLVGTRFLDHIDAVHQSALTQQVHQLRSGAMASFRVEVRCRHAGGQEVWASMHGSYFAQDESIDAHLIVQAFDVTARRIAESRLQHLAYHDGLTDLANRSRLRDALDQAIQVHRTDPTHQFSVLHLSFDRFKLLNDSLGGGVGDRFLVAVARRLQDQVRPEDVLARLAGDDFGVLVFHVRSGTHQAIALAERLQRAFVAPIKIDDTEVHTGVNIGIAFSDVGYTEADEALRDASLAMAKAKADGKARYAIFDPSLHERASEQLQLETELRHALDEGQLTLAYQPVFGISPQHIAGFEALARWPHATRGMVSPAQFIPVAEESGQIVALTRWALRESCRQLSDWRQRFPGGGQLFVNVNITGQDLGEAGFADLVRDVLASHDLPAHCLTLEITETALMQQLELGQRTLARLREMGVGLSVDDFGTGYSSLSLLSTLPINSLKIDRSFVDRLDGASVESEIVRAVVQLGHALDKRVVAEGIETAAQLQRLRDLQCGYGQGFLLSRPLSPLQVEAMLSGSIAEGVGRAEAGQTMAATAAARLPVAPVRGGGQTAPNAVHEA